MLSPVLGADPSSTSTTPVDFDGVRDGEATTVIHLALPKADGGRSLSSVSSPPEAEVETGEGDSALSASRSFAESALSTPTMLAPLLDVVVKVAGRETVLAVSPLPPGTKAGKEEECDWALPPPAVLGSIAESAVLSCSSPPMLAPMLDVVVKIAGRETVLAVSPLPPGTEAGKEEEDGMALLPPTTVAELAGAEEGTMLSPVLGSDPSSKYTTPVDFDSVSDEASATTVVHLALPEAEGGRSLPSVSSPPEPEAEDERVEGDMAQPAAKKSRSLSAFLS